MTAMTLERASTIAAALKPETRAFIGGAYVNAKGGATFTTINPATGQPLVEVAHCQPADVDAAVRAARGAFEAGTWSRAAPEARKEVLLKLADLVREHKEELAVLESLDSGKTITDCLHEIGNEVAELLPVVRRADRQDLRQGGADRRAGAGADRQGARRRGRAGAAVEFPAADGGMEAGAGAGRRLLLPGQARRADAADRDPARRARDRGRVSRRACSTSFRALARPPARRSAGIPTSTSSPSPARPRSAAISCDMPGECNMKAVGLEMGGKSRSSSSTMPCSTTTTIENAAMSAVLERRPELLGEHAPDGRPRRSPANSPSGSWRAPSSSSSGNPLDPETTLPADGHAPSIGIG